jgi:hypothetical protein
MKRLIIIFLVYYVKSAMSQDDTLNKYNSNHKKEGYWICYLDKKLKKTDSSRAFFYGYELFDNGKNVTNTSNRNIKAYSIVIPQNVEGKTKPVLLEGKFTFYDKKGLLVSIEEYQNGYPYILKGYKTIKYQKLYNFETEFLDFHKKYNDQQGSFYFEERGTNLKDTTKYWFRKVDGKWKSVKIE